MADSQSPPQESSGGESKAQRDARLRRERRNAKLQADGSSRLSKITSMSGRPAAAEAELNRTTSSTRSKPSSPQPDNSSTRGSGGHADDPAEVDISNMFRSPPQETGMDDQQEVFRRMLRAGGENDGTGAGEAGQAQDPMMQMMQQMMASMGGDNGQQPGAPGGGLPPGLANMFGNPQDQPQEEQASGGEHLWRIVHAIFSLLIGVYAVAILSFTGTKMSRSEYSTDPIGPQLFWIFATAELVLQTTHYFLDRGKLPASSMLGKIAAFLPEPYAGYLRLVNRYSIIYTTIASDALVVVFVLGAYAWWNGLADR